MRFFARFLISGLIWSLIPFPIAKAISYTDVNSAYKYYKAISSLSDQDIVSGYPNRSFRPEQTINRAEALKILVKAKFSQTDIEHALDDHRARNHSYVNLPDVSINDWFGPYIQIAFVKNIARGYADNTFRPTSPINFAEGLKMILATDKINPAYSFRSSPMLYVQPNDWFAPHFAYAITRNLINAKKFYHPGQLMTRGEFAEIFYRLNEIQSKRLAYYIDDGDDVAGVSNEYKITIPRLNIINQPVGLADPHNASAALDLLRHFPLGHYLATPGSGKKSVLYGHSSGYSWDHSPYKLVLRQIDKLQIGDKIFINYKEEGCVYVVSGTEIVPEKEDKKIMENQLKNELAIYTCWPPNSTKYRYVVYASLVFFQ